MWQALDAQSRKGIYSDLHTYFDAVPRPPDDISKIESLEDLTPVIELYQSLIGLERYEDAFVLFCVHLERATLYRLSASRQRAELLERLFPDGVENIPRLRSGRDQGEAFNALAHAYLFRGEPGRAAALYHRSVEIHERANDVRLAAVSLVGLSHSQWQSGALRLADFASQRAVQLGREHQHLYSAGQGEYSRGINLALCGLRDGSEIALKRSLKTWISENHQQGEGAVKAYLAQRLLWFGDPKRALPLAQRAWELAGLDRNEADFIGAARLHGTAALGLKDLNTATERPQHALTAHEQSVASKKNFPPSQRSLNSTAARTNSPLLGNCSNRFGMSPNVAHFRHSTPTR